MKRRPSIPLVFAGVVALLAVLGGALLYRAESRVNHKTLSAGRKGVTVENVKATTYRAARRYVGSIVAWQEARIGPQYVSAYVTEVAVRPGDQRKRGEVLARLQCDFAAANMQAASQQARAFETEQEALASEGKRMQALAKEGFISENEVDKKIAASQSQQARLLSAKAKSVSSAIEQSDCLLRAPFDGEVADRMVDPGAFVRPGTAMLVFVDRRKVRINVDVPESDFAMVKPGTPVRIHMLSGVADVTAPISRRAPSAEAGTRTIHVEVDLANDDRQLPTGVTAELFLDVGEPVQAIEVPLIAAGIRNGKATVFVVEGDTVHKKTVRLLGERAGKLYLDAAFSSDAQIVVEGRAALVDGDKVDTLSRTAPVAVQKDAQ